MLGGAFFLPEQRCLFLRIPLSTRWQNSQRMLKIRTGKFTSVHTAVIVLALTTNFYLSSLNTEQLSVSGYRHSYSKKILNGASTWFSKYLIFKFHHQSYDHNSLHGGDADNDASSSGDHSRQYKSRHLQGIIVAYFLAAFSISILAKQITLRLRILHIAYCTYHDVRSGVRVNHV